MRIVRGDGGTPYAGRFTGRSRAGARRGARRLVAGHGARALPRRGGHELHRHPGGQNLWLVEGRGRIGNAVDGEVEIEPGTLVVTPPLERHWHGAAAGADAVWLTMTWGATEWEDAAPEA